MTRRKSPAQSAPQTLPEAIALLTRYATLAAGLAQVELDREEALSQINAAADKLTAPFEAELRDLVRQLKPWWSVARDELTEGKRKSIELAGCLIGYRMSNPKLVFNGAAIGKANEADLVAILLDYPAEDLVRIKREIDKQTALKLLGKAGDHDAALLRWLGLEASQREEFFVDRVPPKSATVETVADPLAEEVA